MILFLDIGDTLIDEADFAAFRHEQLFEFFMRRGATLGFQEFMALQAQLAAIGRIPLIDQLKWLAQRLGGDTLLAMEVYRDFVRQVLPQAPARFKPFHDADAVLRELAALHVHGEQARLGIIANQPLWIRNRLDDWNLLSYFEPQAVVISDEVGVAKPDENIFLFALAQADVPADEAFMIGNDYAFDIIPASQLGMHTIWIDREDPYAPDAPPVEDSRMADAHVHHLADVPAAVRRIIEDVDRAKRNGNHHAGRRARPLKRTR